MAERNLFDEDFSRLEAEFREQLSARDAIITGERVARNNMEILKDNQMKDSEIKLRELLGHVDKLNLNLQMAVATRASVEDKNTTLTDQKKILVKEVKTLRKKVDASAETMTELQHLNDRLSKAVETLQNQVKLLSVRNHLNPADDTAGGEEADSITANMEDAMQIDTSAFRLEKKSPVLAATDDKRSDVPDEMLDDDWQNQTADTIGGDAVGPDNEEEGSYADGRRPSWGIPGTTLMELGWLSNEQRNLIAQRAGIDPTAAPANNNSNISVNVSGESGSETNNMSSGGSIINSIAATLFFAGPSELPIQPNTSSITNSGASKRGSYFSSISPSALLSSGQNNTDAVPSTAQPSKRSSFLGSMFSTDKKISTPAITVDDVVKAPVSDSRRRPSDFFDSPLPLDDSTVSAADAKLRCLRCGGTVEGPKYSTCKCQIPALTPDALTAGVPTPVGGSAAATGSKMFSVFSLASSPGFAPPAGGPAPSSSSSPALPSMGKMMMPSLGPDLKSGSIPPSLPFSSVLFGAPPTQKTLTPAELLAKWDQKLPQPSRRSSSQPAPSVPPVDVDSQSAKEASLVSDGSSVVREDNSVDISSTSESEAGSEGHHGSRALDDVLNASSNTAQNELADS
jgi:hypothetical protein